MKARLLEKLGYVAIFLKGLWFLINLIQCSIVDGRVYCCAMECEVLGSQLEAGKVAFPKCSIFQVCVVMFEHTL